VSADRISKVERRKEIIDAMKALPGELSDWFEHHFSIRISC
jgi:hypothetical protein